MSCAAGDKAVHDEAPLAEGGAIRSTLLTDFGVAVQGEDHRRFDTNPALYPKGIKLFPTL